VPIEVKDDSLSPSPLASPPIPLSATSPILVPSILPHPPISPALPSSVPFPDLSNKRKACYELRDDVSNTSMEDETEEHQDLSPSLPNILNNGEVISIVEKGEDLTKFKFHYIKNGTKELKDKKQHIANRLHYKCNQHDKEGVNCMAMYKVTVLLANPNNKYVFFLREEDRIHNHHPPNGPRKRAQMEVNQKERVADLLHMGVKPARIHQKLVIEDPEKVLSMSQLNNLSYRESMKDMPYSVYSLYLIPYLVH
jgi:hypothetical protein